MGGGGLHVFVGVAHLRCLAVVMGVLLSSRAWMLSYQAYAEANTLLLPQLAFFPLPQAKLCEHMCMLASGLAAPSVRLPSQCPTNYYRIPPPLYLSTVLVVPSC